MTTAYAVNGQDTTTVDYQQHYDQARVYINANLYAEGIASLNQAISTAREHNLEEQYLQASIELAETYRKTANFELGIKLLFELGKQPEYPLQEVKRLGRIAAIYHQIIGQESGAQWDSVTKYLDPAMKLSIEHNFTLELASLKNEYGYLLGHYESWDAGIPYHMEAAQIYFDYGDKRNYAGVMTKVLNQLVHHPQDFAMIDSLIDVVLLEVEDKKWYPVEIELFRVLAFYNASYRDGTVGLRWENKALLSELHQNRTLNTQQLENLRVSYETQKFQDEAKLSTEELGRQKARYRQMIVFLFILALMMLLVAVLFYRERKTKRTMDQMNQQLQVANERYHMLMIESNHRIKNNLQMIISMLEYAGKDLNPENTRALKRMSGKIHTISALHKHLYADVHNAKVDLATYFREIISLYTELSKDDLQVFDHFDEVSIPSERLVYFGLILNEMLSNTLEHNAQASKEVKVSTTRQDKVFRFEYRDNSPHQLNGSTGTGTLLIRQLIERIGGQNFEFDPIIGRYTFQFYA